MDQPQRIELRAFVVHVSWIKDGDKIIISAALSHKDLDLKQPPLTAEMVRVQLADDQGREWLCSEQPHGQLIATTGPGMVTHARYVFQPPSPDSTSKTLTITVVDSGTLALTG